MRAFSAQPKGKSYSLGLSRSSSSLHAPQEAGEKWRRPEYLVSIPLNGNKGAHAASTYIVFLCFGKELGLCSHIQRRGLGKRLSVERV
jgi:hypothetical protein